MGGGGGVVNNKTAGAVFVSMVIGDVIDIVMVMNDVRGYTWVL